MQISSALQDTDIHGFLGLPQALLAKDTQKAKTVYDQISKFVTDFRQSQDELSQLVIYKELLDLQPISVQDIKDYFTINAASLGNVDINGVMSELSKIDDPNKMSFDDIQVFVINHKNLFGSDLQKLITDLIGKSLINPNRDATKFEVKDEFKFKIQTSLLDQMRLAIRQSYEYYYGSFVPYEQYYLSKYEYPQSFYDKLFDKGISAEFIDFAKLFAKEYNDPSYVISDGDGDSVNYRNIDYNLYKKIMYILFIKSGNSLDKDGHTLNFPTPNLVSKNLIDNHKNPSGQIIYDEAILRTFVFKLNAHNRLEEGLKEKGETFSTAIVSRGTSGFSELFNPVSNFMYNFRSKMKQLDEIGSPIRGFEDIRRAFEDGYDSLLDYNTKIYKDIMDDPLSNLGSEDLQNFLLTMSVAMDTKLAKFASKPYVDKNVLIGVYAAIALVLVTLAY